MAPISPALAQSTLSMGRIGLGAPSSSSLHALVNSRSRTAGGRGDQSGTRTSGRGASVRCEDDSILSFSGGGASFFAADNMNPVHGVGRNSSTAASATVRPLTYTFEEQRQAADLYRLEDADASLAASSGTENGGALGGGFSAASAAAAAVAAGGTGTVNTAPTLQRKTKIVCTIGPTSNTRDMIWALAEAGMTVARLNMSHGDHASHRKVVDLVREYNKHAVAHGNGSSIGIMLDTKGPEVRSGDLPQPVDLQRGDSFTFTIRRGVGTHDAVSVNYDGFIDDVDVGDIVLVDGGIMAFKVAAKDKEDVLCHVVDGGELKSRRHLNVRGKSATLPSITEKDWEDIRFGVENKVDFYALSFVKDAEVVHELKAYLRGQGADIQVIAKIESADSIPNLHAILEASDGAMVARGDLGAELPIEEVPLLQDTIIQLCHSMGKPVVVATNMLESMINHPTPTRAEVSDIAIAVREGADAIMLSGETAHGKYPLKAVRMMHTVALQTEATTAALRVDSPVMTPAALGSTFKRHTSEMFAFHATMMANTLGASVLVFTRSGFMATLLSHYRPNGITFAFTNDKRVQQRLSIYHGVKALYMPFSSDAEDTFTQALTMLLKRGLVRAGEDVAIVQSGRQPIWRSESTHHIQVRRVRTPNANKGLRSSDSDSDDEL